MVRPIEEPENRIADLFNDKTLLITGASGFLGKVLIEKLLRSCSGLRKIYVLLREKKGKNINQRLEDMFNLPLFDLLKKQKGNSIFEKVEVVAGDVAAPDLAISPEDRKKIAEEVQFIYHIAATVQFDEPLKRAVLLNVRGTKLMLALAKECRNLLAFCHLSTAYCQEAEAVLYERTYPPPADPHKIISMCEWMDEKVLDSIADKIRGHSANNYTFTKALGEGLVAEQMDKLPVIIARPSAVVPSWKEPMPGWVDNINGPVGLLLGAGKGVIRTMYCQNNYFVDYIPVDSVANALISVIFDTIVLKRGIRVYNLAASEEVKVTFHELLEMGRSIVYNDICFDLVLWFPGGGITTSRWVHNFRLLFTQLIPAVLLDGVLFLVGYKPFLVRVQKKILRGYGVFEYYTNRKWDIRKDKSYAAVSDIMTRVEQEEFPLEANNFDLRQYIFNAVLGLRRYLLNERDENMRKARRRMNILWALDRLLRTVLIVGIMYLIFKMVIHPMLNILSTSS